MTKADIVKNISDQTGVDKTDVQMIVEKFMDQVRDSIPAHNIPSFKPSKTFIESVKKNVPVG